jgi:lipoprotein NlpD
MNIARSSSVAAAAVLLAACVAQRPAPVVDRTAKAAPTRPPVTAPAAPARDAKDGVYTVQRGDTLYSIATAFNVDVRELARWNDLPDAGVLRVGQTLRVTPPADAAVATVTPVTPGGGTEVRPLPAPGAPGLPAPVPPAPLPPPGTTPPAAVASAPPTLPAPAAPESSPAAKPETATTSAVQWQWPAAGKVIDGFDAPRNKGIDIAGAEGAAVQAAADGEVVHVGSALRGYGNLVIIRHAGDFVTAYGHNRKVLVAQGQQVKRGQQIAELGKTDADRPKLHFEIRHQGKPLDPVKYLPSR